MPPLGIVVALLLSLGPVPVRAQDARLAAAEERILLKLDPDAAEAFLKDRALQGGLQQSAPARLAPLLKQAAELKDMRDLLRLHNDVDDLRRGLRVRLPKEALFENWPAQSVFGGDPQKLIGWAHRTAPQSGQLLREALWEWPTLSPGMVKFLIARQVTAGRWKTLPFHARWAQLRVKTDAEMKALLLLNPKTRGEFDRMKERELEIWGTLDGEEREVLGDRVRKGEEAVSALESLAARPDLLANPELAERLARVRAADTLDGSLTGLSQLFDRLGERRESLEKLRPAKPSETLAGGSRRLLQDMLHDALLREVGGTGPGDALQAFYREHPLRLILKDMPSNIAVFHSEGPEIWVNEKQILEWVKAAGHTADDLLKSPVFDDLVMLLASTFVHEATHQVQFAWAEKRKLPDWSGQHIELEAMTAEALYVLQKAAPGSKYEAFLARARKTSTLADGDAARAESLRRDPRAFRAAVLVDSYPDSPSLEGMAAGSVASKTATLKEKAAVAAHYQAYRERLEKSNRAVDEALARLRSGVGSALGARGPPAPPPPAKPGAPPL